MHLNDVIEASERIKPYIHQTPVLTSKTLDKLVNEKYDGDFEFYLKCENLQKTGSFKVQSILIIFMYSSILHTQHGSFLRQGELAMLH